MLKGMPNGFIANAILRALPTCTVAELAANLDLVELRRGQVLYRLNAPVEHVYFVNRGLVSQIRTMHDGRVIEIGAVGIEGMADLSAVLGFERAILEMIVQIPGQAFRIQRTALQEAMHRSERLRMLLRDYGQWAIGQIAQTAACNRLHSLEERCCRWLLIAHDNARSATFTLTQEFFALMLGVQRPSLSVTTASLRRADCIDYHAGAVTILDRAGLERRACECYETIHGQWNAVFAGYRGNDAGAGTLSS